MQIEIYQTSRANTWQDYYLLNISPDNCEKIRGNNLRMVDQTEKCVKWFESSRQLFNDCSSELRLEEAFEQLIPPSFTIIPSGVAEVQWCRNDKKKKERRKNN